MSDHLSRKLAGLNRQNGREASKQNEVDGGDGSSALRPAEVHRRAGLTVLTPLHYEPSYAYPLLIWFHSGGHNEHQVEQVLPHISVRNYVAIGIRGSRALDVQGHRFDWSSGHSATLATVDAIEEAIDIAGCTLNLHPERVILAGYQSGATMACRVALMNPRRYAGVIRMGGRMPSGRGILGNYAELRKRRMPMLWQQAINGNDDESERLREEINMAMSIQARVEIRQYRNDDVMNTAALRDINQWCFDKIITPKPAEDDSFLSDAVSTDRTLVQFSSN